MGKHDLQVSTSRRPTVIEPDSIDRVPASRGDGIPLGKGGWDPETTRNFVSGAMGLARMVVESRNEVAKIEANADAEVRKIAADIDRIRAEAESYVTRTRAESEAWHSRFDRESEERRRTTEKVMELLRNREISDNLKEKVIEYVIASLAKK